MSSPGCHQDPVTNKGAGPASRTSRKQTNHTHPSHCVVLDQRALKKPEVKDLMKEVLAAGGCSAGGHIKKNRKFQKTIKFRIILGITKMPYNFDFIKIKDP